MVPVTPDQNPLLVLLPAQQRDLEPLLAIRIEAMRESLERVGRFDPVRARERFASGFDASSTRHIEVAGERVGFVVLKQHLNELLLDHLYVKPAAQGAGLAPLFWLRFSKRRMQPRCLSGWARSRKALPTASTSAMASNSWKALNSTIPMSGRAFLQLVQAD